MCWGASSSPRFPTSPYLRCARVSPLYYLTKKKVWGDVLVASYFINHMPSSILGYGPYSILFPKDPLNVVLPRFTSLDGYNQVFIGKDHVFSIICIG